MSLAHLNSSLPGTSGLNDLARNASLANSESPQHNYNDMSLTHLNSSLLGTSCLNDLALYASLANSESPQHNYSEQRVFQVIPKPLGHIIGEGLRNFFDFFYSKLPTFPLPGAKASPVVLRSETLLAVDHCESPTGSCLDNNFISEPQVYDISQLENRFTKIEFIGSGGGGCVYAVIDKTTKEVKALKMAVLQNSLGKT